MCRPHKLYPMKRRGGIALSILPPLFDSSKSDTSSGLEAEGNDGSVNEGQVSALWNAWTECVL